MPKPNGYGWLHTTVVQKVSALRYRSVQSAIHYVAEPGIAAHWKYKAHGESHLSL